MNLHIFTFNPFSENTYVVAGEDGGCTIIDPGCYDQSEFDLLAQHLEINHLTVNQIVLTHAHLDHVFGLKRCLDAYEVDFYMNDIERPVLDSVPMVSKMYGVHCDPVDTKHVSLTGGQVLTMAGEEWHVLFTPGHSPGSVCFYHAASAQVIAGDVLFRDSIGRTDLPGGHHETLLHSIKEQLYVLPDETKVYPGHGPETTIGYEKMNNPFVRSTEM